MANKQISSTQNPLIKHIVLLKDKSRERKKTNTFVLEGEREIQLALDGEYAIQTILVLPEIYDITKLLCRWKSMVSLAGTIFTYGKHW